MINLAQLNTASPLEFCEALDGTYEHSSWIVSQALSARPFKSLADLKLALVAVVDAAPKPQQLALIKAHPELAGKAMVDLSLTAESSNEQGKAGLTHCTPAEFEKMQSLNAAYNAKFGFPFILAVRGPRGLGLDRTEIIKIFERRLGHHPDFEFAECLRNIHRIAEIRLNDKLGFTPSLGNAAWDWAEQLAQHSDPGYAERGELTVTYLTAAHQACAKQLQTWMGECGFDSVRVDDVGNVVGIYEGSETNAQRLLTGSHFDSVRNGGKYDGRLGIFIPMLCVRELHKAGKRLPFGLEVVGFSEEEGQRYKATFLGSGALVGQFNTAWLDQTDSDGITMRSAMHQVGLDPDRISDITRDPKQYMGFVEVHIEQGPILNARNLPLGIVTAINGSVRYMVEIIGLASHAGTTPMAMRKDAATAAAEVVLYLEQRAASHESVVGTVGMLEVVSGSTNVVPGRCRFTLDIRATTDAARDACAQDTLAHIEAICLKRGLSFQIEQTMQASAAPSNPQWQARWENAVTSLGLPLFRMPSGAGHDAMKLHEVMPQAMLFVRGLNAGISHNPLEALTNDDADLLARAFAALLDQLADEHRRPNTR